MKSFLIFFTLVAIWLSYASTSSAATFKGTLGTTSYEYKNTGSEKILVFVHGVNGPRQIWDPLLARMQAEQQYNLLTYDLFGRGESGFTKGKYDLNTWRTQLNELLQHLNINKNIVLIGSSMGGIIVADYALEYPDQVVSVVMANPAGFPLDMPFLAKLNRVPVLGDLMSAIFGKSVLRKRNREYLRDPDRHEAFLKLVDKQLERDETVDAIRKTVLQMPLNDFMTRYSALGRLGKRLLLLWGTEDVSIPYDNHKLAIAAMPSIQFKSIRSAAHLPMLDAPEVFHQILQKFLQFPAVSN